MLDGDVKFVKFSKIPRLESDCVIMEKIDGANAQVMVSEDSKRLWFGSRNRWLCNTSSEDLYGFCKWGLEHKEELLKLGPGRHYGEWWGQGINRGYGLEDRRFSLFDIYRWATERPACCGVVPVICKGPFSTGLVDKAMERLAQEGSLAVPGYGNPEGVVVYHIQGGKAFKKSYE